MISLLNSYAVGQELRPDQLYVGMVYVHYKEDLEYTSCHFTITEIWGKGMGVTGVDDGIACHSPVDQDTPYHYVREAKVTDDMVQKVQKHKFMYNRK